MNIYSKSEKGYSLTSMPPLWPRPWPPPVHHPRTVLRARGSGLLPPRSS